MDEMDELRRLWATVPEGSAADLAGSRTLLARAYTADRHARGPRRLPVMTAWRSVLPVKAGRSVLPVKAGRSGLPVKAGRSGLLVRAVAVAGATAVIGVAVHLVPGALPPASAQDVLERAADAAAEQKEVTLRPGQYLHVRSVAAQTLTVGRKDGSGADHLALTVAEDRWEPATAGRPWLVREERTAATPLPGSRLPSLPWRRGVEDSVYESSCDKTPGDELSYLRLGDWPTDVAALRARIEKAAAQEAGPVNLRLWTTISRLVRMSAARPALAAPLFEVASGLDGISLDAEATDAAGRPGMAVGMAENDSLRSELVFDKDTYRYLGTRHVVMKDRTETPGGHTFVIPKGTVTGSALLGVEAADTMPEPAPHASRLKIPC
ncbi:CU044_5270 family protein [Nonomuraea sp. NPDC003727]